MEAWKMLSMTTRASEAVEDVLAVPGLPDTVGIRITPRRAARFRRDKVDVALEEPAPGDAMVIHKGVCVFVDERASGYVAGKVLDAQIDERWVMFTISDQPFRRSARRAVD